MTGRVVVLLILCLATAACASQPTGNAVEWQGHVLREVSSVEQLPALLKSGLGVGRPGVDGIADRGQRFNVTDVVDPQLPMRRFLVAGYDGETWLVAVERGGRGYSIEIFLFIAQDPYPKQKWVSFERAGTLQEVVRQISQGKAA